MTTSVRLINPEDVIDKSIFDLLGIADASESDKNKILSDMLETIQNRVIARIYDALSEEERKELENLFDKGDDKGVNTYLASKNVNVAQISAEESLYYKVNILGLTEKQGGA